jgi:glucose-1-phosphatase
MTVCIDLLRGKKKFAEGAKNEKNDTIGMNSFKHIIFDFGNVLLNIDMNRIKLGFEAKLGLDYPLVFDQLNANHVFQLYEVGGLSTSEFIEQICQADPKGRLDADSVTAIWNSIFIGMPAHRFDMLLALRGKYQVYLLSNINDLHCKWIEAYLASVHGIHDFEQRYFDGVYYSHFLRLRKPDVEIYSFVLADAELKAEDCIFFDDLPQNVAAACQLQIHGVLHDPARDIADHITELGLMRHV